MEIWAKRSLWRRVIAVKYGDEEAEWTSRLLKGSYVDVYGFRMQYLREYIG